MWRCEEWEEKRNVESGEELEGRMHDSHVALSNQQTKKWEKNTSSSQPPPLFTPLRLSLHPPPWPPPTRSTSPPLPTTSFPHLLCNLLSLSLSLSILGILIIFTWNIYHCVIVFLNLPALYALIIGSITEIGKGSIT